MNIAYSGFNELLTLQEGEIYRITIEEPRCFRKFIEDLLEDMNQDTENIVLSENNKALKSSKASEIILNPFALELNNKKILQRLYNDLQKITVDAELYEKTLQVRKMLNSFLLDITLQSDYMLKYDVDFEMKDVFSAVKMRLEDDACSLLEKIAAYIRTLHEFLGIKVFWLVNIGDYFTKEEQSQLFRQTAYDKVNLIILEHSYSGAVEEEKLFVIDKDLCIIKCDN